MTPDRITRLNPGEIFVFGSNVDGFHNGGAAGFACRHFGAVYGNPEGPQGQCYAIPTVGLTMRRLHIKIQDFIDYAVALQEVKEGYKASHWMWYIFPQIKGLERSDMALYYAITSLDEAKAYLTDEILGTRLREISEELLRHSDVSIQGILGGIDSMKLKSSMTLFDLVSPDDVFARVLDVFFEGKRDDLTIKIVGLPF